jgi:hypothetical protein
MPRRCSDRRNFRLSYPLSAISCRGRDFGLPYMELDYLINYDIKYRMGQESGEGV